MLRCLHLNVSSRFKVFFTIKNLILVDTEAGTPLIIIFELLAEFLETSQSEFMAILLYNTATQIVCTVGPLAAYQYS